MRTLKLITGVVLVLLGLLWALQGADLIRIKPILCVANCEPMTGGSSLWLLIGIVTIAIGLLLLVPFKRKSKP